MMTQHSRCALVVLVVVALAATAQAYSGTDFFGQPGVAMPRGFGGHPMFQHMGGMFPHSGFPHSRHNMHAQQQWREQMNRQRELERQRLQQRQLEQRQLEQQRRLEQQRQFQEQQRKLEQQRRVQEEQRKLEQQRAEQQRRQQQQQQQQHLADDHKEQQRQLDQQRGQRIATVTLSKQYEVHVAPKRDFWGQAIPIDVRFGRTRDTVVLQERSHGGLRQEFRIPEDVSANDITTHRAANGNLVVVFPRVAEATSASPQPDSAPAKTTSANTAAKEALKQRIQRRYEEWKRREAENGSKRGAPASAPQAPKTRKVSEAPSDARLRRRQRTTTTIVEEFDVVSGDDDDMVVEDVPFDDSVVEDSDAATGYYMRGDFVEY